MIFLNSSGWFIHSPIKSLHMKPYWRFSNYVASYERQEFKDLSKPQTKHDKKRH